MSSGLILLAALQAVTLESGLTTEIRGLHAADSAVVWAGARNGWYARTADGGRSWTADTVPGAGPLFFVDVHAVNAESAYLLGQHFEGGLARIYKTVDGGATWTVQFESTHPDIFLDGLAFWTAERGLAFGDPIEGAFVMLRTDDGGATWDRVAPQRIPAPLPGEAAFAASGTAITVHADRLAWIVTGGGPIARVLLTTDAGHTWAAADTPLAGGRTAGLFAVAFRDALNGLAVGGDYTRPEGVDDNVMVTRDGGRTWTLAGRAEPAGVRWGLAVVPGAGTWIAVGPSGVGTSRDGHTWIALDAPGFNTVTAAGPAAVWAAGGDGRVARLRLP